MYEHPFTLLMNMAVGGNFGGPLADTLTFPQELKVDYIRVYQAPERSEKFETTFTDDEAGWRFVQLPFRDFERSADQPEGAADDGFGRTAITGYEIEVSGAPAPATTAAAQSFAIFAADDGAVSLDKVQVLAEVTDPGTGGGDGDGDGDGGDGDGGDGDGTGGSDGGTGGGSDGTGATTGSGGQGGLAATGGSDLTPIAALALLVMGLGAALLRRHRWGVRAER